MHLDKRPGGISRRDPAILCISAARAPPHSTRLSAPQSDYYGGGEVPAVGMLSTAHPKASPLAFRDLTPFPSHHRPPSAQRSTPRRQRARHDTVASTLRPSVALIETASVPERILTYATSSTPRPPHAAPLRLSRVVCSCRLKGTRLDMEVHGLDDIQASKFTAVCHSTTSPKAARTDTGLRTASTRKCCRKMLLRVPRLQHVQDVLLVRYFY